MLELTFRQALRMGHNYIGTEHILLALLEFEDGTGVLSSLGLDKAAPKPMSPRPWPPSRRGKSKIRILLVYTHPARRLWATVETLHDVTYFAEGVRAAGIGLGLRGYWMTYFAFRAAPLGAVPAGPVVAAFAGFCPAMVAKALPDAWSRTTPQSLPRYPRRGQHRGAPRRRGRPGGL